MVNDNRPSFHGQCGARLDGGGLQGCSMRRGADCALVCALVCLWCMSLLWSTSPLVTACHFAFILRHARDEPVL